MKTKLTMMAAMAATCAAIQLMAMPKPEEAKQVVQGVRDRLVREQKALESGRMTRSEVAAAARELADKAETDAEKLLLMKGAFVLYVRDGKLEKAVETIKALEAAISDMPPQSVTNMIEMALLGVSRKGDGTRLYELLGEAKPTSRKESTTEKANKDLAKLYPGWTLESWVPQENRKEHASGFWAHHRGQDNVVRFHPLNKETPVILKRTVKLSGKNPCLFLKVASFDAHSDFVLSVRVNGKEVMPGRIVRTPDSNPWEDLVVPLADYRGKLAGIEIVAKANDWWCEWSYFANIEISEGNGQETCGLAGVKYGTETVDGYTWSYFVKNGEATIAAEKNGNYSCAVSPSPKGAITIPETLGGVKVTGIGRNLFKNCKEVTSVTIPDGVTSIGPSAFDLCFGLKSVTIPSSVKTIGEWAFSACFRLQPVTMPESLEYIGKGAFINCRSMKMVNIPAKLSVIGDAAFAYCTGLQQFTVDGRNETFAAKDGILYSKDMSTLVSVPNVSTIARIPSSVTKIGVSAFQGRYRLESLTIPESVTIIDRGAFHDCVRLGSMTIPASVTKIGPKAFNNCGALTEVTMLGERPETSNDIFNKNCGKLKAIHVPANAKSWAGMKEWQGIPLVFDGEARAASEKALNSGNATPKDVPNVEYKFFYKLENGKAIITGIDPKSVGTAGPVGSLVIPDKIDGHSVTHIGWEAFRYCKELTSVTIPEGVTHIDGHTFDQCYGLKSVTLPSSLKGIGWAAFGGCAELKSIVIPEGVTSIRADTFNGCRSLKNVVIPNSMTHIGDRAFLGCQELTSVTIPAKVASIGEGAFGGGSKLKQINLAAGNQSFILVDGVLYKKDMSVLLACPGTMTSVTIPSGVTKIGALAFCRYDGLKSVTLPDGLMNIPWGAFAGCKGLTSVKIPSSVKVIGPDAFKECYGLQSVTIPSSVKSIDGGAFFRCGGLTEVTMLGERPEAPNDIFQGCGKLKAIHVPANAKSWAGMKEWQGIPLVFDVLPSTAEKDSKDLYMIVDLTKTGKSAISYLKDVPKNGWGDEYRTKKIALRKIAPGSFEYLPGKSFKITKPFYIGVFEVTQKQYAMIMKTNPSAAFAHNTRGDTRPVDSVSYIDPIVLC